MATLSSLADVALAELPIEASIVRCAVALTLLFPGLALLTGAGCSRAADDSRAAGSAALASPSPSTTWSREALAPRGAGAEPLDPAVMGSVDPGALDDLVRAMPKLTRNPTAPAGGTAIGSDSGVAASASPPVEPPPAEASRTPKVVVGSPTVQASMANPAIERAARAQLYWNLVQRCRDKDGNILPADAISLRFLIDADGYISPSSIVATAGSTSHTEAAHCMRRELSTATFRAPAATWGHPGEVRATLPSVD